MLLTIPLAIAHARVEARQQLQPVRASLVDRMYPQFEAWAREYSAHIVDSNAKNVQEVAAEVRDGIRSGRFRIS